MSSSTLGWIYTLALLALPPLVWLWVWHLAGEFGRQGKGVRPTLTFMGVTGAIAMSATVLHLLLSPGLAWSTILSTVAGTAFLAELSPFLVPWFWGRTRPDT